MKPVVTRTGSHPCHTSPETFTINPDCQVSVEHVGLGRHKVVMVDGFYRYPDRVLQQALELPYTDRFEIVGNFPGVRASVNVETGAIVDAISEFWGMKLYPFFDPQPIVFQGITNHQYRLNVGQRQPHIDQDITAMVYLNPPNPAWAEPACTITCPRGWNAYPSCRTKKSANWPTGWNSAMNFSAVRRGMKIFRTA